MNTGYTYDVYALSNMYENTLSIGITMARVPKRRECDYEHLPCGSQKHGLNEPV